MPENISLPTIIVNDKNKHLKDLVSECLDALYKYQEKNPESLFMRGGKIVRINTDEKDRPYIDVVTEATLKLILDHIANFAKIVQTKDNVEKQAARPPQDVVRSIYEYRRWKLSYLEGITEVPVLRHDGSVLTQPGYDSTSHLYYNPKPNLNLQPTADHPTENEVKESIELVLECLCDFPFDSDASKANAIAAIFTPILRPMIQGPVPMFLFDKPKAGTGASLLTEIISVIATGREAAMMSAKKGEDEWKKSITSTLLRGEPVVTIDNIEGRFYAPSLAIVLTASQWQDRILGRNENVVLPIRTTFIGSGNNIQLGGDLPRRCVWIRMNAKMARPWLRDTRKFKHPNLLEWVQTKRSSIIAAMLTIARAWVVAGRPGIATAPSLGSYESWCGILDGILNYMGVKGFLTNLGEMYQKADTEGSQWECFIGSIYDHWGDKVFTASELVQAMEVDTSFELALPDSIADRNNSDLNRVLGNALARHEQDIGTNGLMVQRAGSKKNAATWQVVS